ncbi:MAG TPA: S8 family peptidase [Lachnospiraceae bacterium]|nr:S8 family peptidase [Lachnospiraceae bacterium]
MTPEERASITSNDYINIITEYYRKDRFIETLQGLPFNRIDEEFGVFYHPVLSFPKRIIGENGYAMIPKLYGLLDTIHLEEMGVNKVQGNPYLGLQGEGVLLGFVDTGIDYTNPVFQYEDGTTRIVSIWDQTIENTEANERIFNFGTEYTREQLNTALQSENPRSIVPSVDEIGHGTTLAGVAGGGSEESNDFQGVVQKAEFVVVKLKQAKKSLRDFFFVSEEVTCFQEDDIIFAIEYLIDRAKELNRPIVICIGLGTNQGSHTGFDLLPKYLAKVGMQVGRAIIVAAGNEGNSQKHYYGEVEKVTGFDLVELNVGENEKGFTMELWGFAPATFSIDILSPTGEYIPRIDARLREYREIKFLYEKTTVYVDHLVIELQSGDPLILLRFAEPAPGIWKFRVYGRGSSNLKFHMWLPLSNFISDNTYFINPNPDTTITGPATSRYTIAVTAYDMEYDTIYINASRGYTRTNIIKPDVAAPGVGILAPMPGNQFTRVSGTSVAAANVAGIAAMIMEWGIVRGNYSAVSTMQIQRFLIRGVKQNPEMEYPNQIWGYGSVNIYDTLMSLSGTTASIKKILGRRNYDT